MENSLVDKYCSDRLKHVETTNQEMNNRNGFRYVEYLIQDFVKTSDHWKWSFEFSACEGFPAVG